jgi:hypothetical protein
MRVKKLKLRAFIEQRIKEAPNTVNLEEYLSPSAVHADYEKRANRTISFQAVSKMLNHMNLNKEQRKTVIADARKNGEYDILEYPEVKAYLSNARGLRHITEHQINVQLSALRELWELMKHNGYSADPHKWTADEMLTAIATINPYTHDKRGRSTFTHPAAAKRLLSPYSTMFNSLGTLAKGWGSNLCVHEAGELKDFVNFPEMAEFLSNLTDTEAMSREGWTTEFTLMVNMGCREGSRGETGITGLLWEDINFQTKRCSLREKGHSGHAQERWDGVPLDMFPWLHGWTLLTKWHEQQGNPVSGKVFPVTYNQLNDMFHATLSRCKGRLSEINDAMRLHSFGRRTHVQYAHRLGLPLELIAGNAPNGRFGVGWKDLKILVRYYLSEEAEEIDPTELAFMQANPEYAKVLASMQEQNRKIKELLGAF